MKYYNSAGPNPRVVNMFLAEKGVTLARERIDLKQGENRQPAYLARNPAGQTPALELDNGVVIAEVTAICEYLDETYPNPPLIGTSPEERAATRMWTRRIDLAIVEPLANGFRFSDGLGLFKDRIHCIPQAADDLKAIAQEKLAWLDALIAGRDYISGDKMTLADIFLFCFLDFGAAVGQPMNPANRNIAAWFERMKARPSAAASDRQAPTPRSPCDGIMDRGAEPDDNKNGV
jgi:glutathione S-transferase